MKKAFHGGIHPGDHKKSTRNSAVETMPLLERYYVPLKQHIGNVSSAVVVAGDTVKKGQRIAEGDNARCVPIHSPVSGTVTDIALHRDPVSGRSLCFVIESDGKDEWLAGLLTKRDFETLSREEILYFIRENGIVGMGGAAFPTHIKLSPPPDRKIDTLIVNGAECEPYLTSDYRVMMEHAQDVIRGCLIVKKALNVTACSIGIEENKKDAIALLRKCAANAGVTIVPLPTIYPQGGEKMLIRAITGREIPAGKFPMDAGCVVQNISTLKAITDAVERHIPLIERVVTVAGRAVKSPKNVRARIGTRFIDAIEFCGGFRKPASIILMGGPMMGIAQADTEAPIIKACSGILAFTKRDFHFVHESPCIRCGRCLSVCPMKLRPNMLSILSEQRKYPTALLEFDLLDCIECGCCAYVCPAKRNIVQYVRLAKAKNTLFKSAKKQAT